MDTDKLWHSCTADEVIRELGTDLQRGLNTEEAARRLAEYGPNAIPEPPRPGWWRRFLAQLVNPLIYVLFLSAFITAMLGHWTDTAVILGVILINALLGVVQEGKAERALEALGRMLTPHAQVLRDGEVRRLKATELVPGDIVLLQAGDKVPADLRLLRAHQLAADESMLTGESLPVDKSTSAVLCETVLAERTGMAFGGTLVTRGQATGVVAMTGARTELGRISAMLEHVSPLRTPLLNQLDRMASRLSLVILALAVLAFLIGVLWRGMSWDETFLIAVGMAVAAIPEGLPAALTIALAVGVQRMAGRNAIVRRLPAVEALGSVTTICTDKTGTLTCNSQTAVKVLTPQSEYAIEGVGYDPHGRIMLDGRPIEANGDGPLAALMLAGVLCNDSTLIHEKDVWHIGGDPIEGGLLVMARKYGLEPEQIRRDWKRLDERPFDADLRYMASLHRAPDDGLWVMVKGAPELILQRVAEVPPGMREDMQRLAGEGLRLLALARRRVTEEMLNDTMLEDGLEWLGVVGFIDPPREGVPEAVAACQAAGIRVKMITGDHAVTAAAIAAKLGIGNARVMSGDEIARLDEAALASRVRDTDVFARISPEQKLALLRALQRNGEVVAMTGDGVNDAPSIKGAEVGIAMGRSGSEVAREASVIVLADDNFATLAEAVRVGRGVYDNLRKTILYILPSDMGEALIMLTALLLGVVAPITPVQVLWINMVTTVNLAIALALEQPEQDVMSYPPRPPGTSVLEGRVLWRIPLVGGVMVLGAYGLFNALLEQGASLEEARTAALNTIVLMECVYLFNARFLHAPVLNRTGMFGNPVVWWVIAALMLLQMMVTYAPFMHALLGTAPLEAATWGWMVLVSLSVLVVVELEVRLGGWWVARTTTSTAA
ncbi:MAG: HAD-IC family P-type ATPase [Pseudomonadota bacterium]